MTEVDEIGEVIWNGGPLLPPRETKPQLNLPFTRITRLYNRKRKVEVIKDVTSEADLPMQEIRDAVSSSVD